MTDKYQIGRSGNLVSLTIGRHTLMDYAGRPPLDHKAIIQRFFGGDESVRPALQAFEAELAGGLG